MENVRTMPLIFSSGKGQRNCLLRGTGIALCPERVVARHLAEGKLVKLEWEPAPMETMIMMITHVEKWCSPPMERFMELAREALNTASDNSI